MLVYAEQITPRLAYITQTLLNNVSLTSSLSELGEFYGPKICYAHKKFDPDSLHIIPNGLLSSEKISQQVLNPGTWQGLPTIFPTAGDLPFDVFAASFYLLSRYEEYLPHQKDVYGRYAHTNSSAYQLGFLDRPLINEWITQLKQQFTTRSYVATSATVFQLAWSYDIDIAYQTRGRNFAVQLLKNIRAGHAFPSSDPFDIYAYLTYLHQHYSITPRFFFLLAKHKSLYDKNLSPASRSLQQLIRHLSRSYPVGIHPSWQSHDDETLLLAEKQQLQKISQQAVTHSRQHYIRFTLPDTYRQLSAAGIMHDHSMGYGSINGFRASYTSPYQWYDLMKEQATNLTVHPFCFMDANAIFEEKLTPEQAYQQFTRLYDSVKAVNGTMSCIFHNHFLATTEEWKGWRKMMEQALAYHHATSPSQQQP